MRKRLRRIGMLDPKAVGIDEISIRKDHTYRILAAVGLVSECARSGVGGKNRSEASMAQFYILAQRQESPRHSPGDDAYVEAAS